ncbi:hypothetical protein [Sporomusa sp.]|uniref:hypothetical protein n=1 Tax=Sporomusa sp. TaxID=2078658 RepID=UPI002B804F13|nr:hypothetical protein [Sporomusa sp.]HWR06733.1 hypothetical protein [Sporomusa sp.]
MKYSYKLRQVDLAHSRKTLAIDLPAEIAVVEILLLSDIDRGSKKWYFEAIDKVLSGESGYQEISGNVCCLEIRKDKTKVIDLLAVEDSDNACEIETNELRELIEVWVDAKSKFDESSNV